MRASQSAHSRANATKREPLSPRTPTATVSTHAASEAPRRLPPQLSTGLLLSFAVYGVSMGLAANDAANHWSRASSSAARASRALTLLDKAEAMVLHPAARAPMPAAEGRKGAGGGDEGGGDVSVTQTARLQDLPRISGGAGLAVEFSNVAFSYPLGKDDAGAPRMALDGLRCRCARPTHTSSRHAHCHAASTGRPWLTLAHDASSFYQDYYAHRTPCFLPLPRLSRTPHTLLLPSTKATTHTTHPACSARCVRSAHLPPVPPHHLQPQGHRRPSHCAGGPEWLR